MKTKSIAILFGSIYLAAHSAFVIAAYPDKPIKLVVPYAVGGTTDIIARVIGVRLGAILGQSLVIENQPGAGGSVGSAYAAKQPADGYTLVMAVESSHAVNPNVYEKSPYDPVKDFATLIQQSNEQWGNVVKDIGFSKLN